MKESALFLPQYAAQAVVDLDLLAKRARNLGDRRALILAELAGLIRNAVHIVLPNRGEIYRDNKGDATIPTEDECDSFNGLPAPICCFEYPWAYDYEPNKNLVDYGSKESESPKRITIVIDGKQGDQTWSLANSDRVSLISIAYNPQFRMWLPHPGVLSVQSPLVVKPSPKSPSAWGVMCALYDLEGLRMLAPGEGDAQLWFGQMKADLIAVVQCCHALRAGASFRETTERSASRRWKFEKKGCGGFTYHVLEIPAHSASGAPRDSGGSHASPRRHIRRAHIRKLPTGALTFVRQCFVGNLSFGAVDKHYSLKGTP